MPKKRVGVSLRKPSPAPDGVQPPPEQPLAPAAGVVGAYNGAGVALDLQPDRVRREATSSAPEPVVVDAFVNGAAAAIERAATAIPAARLQDLLQRGPEGYRELTLYLPEKLAQELALHCLEHNLDMNRLVATAVELHLKGAPSPEPQRPASDAIENQGLLSLAARALLSELTDWVRALWATRRRGLSRAGAPVAS
jgi:hypothetical protein